MNLRTLHKFILYACIAFTATACTNGNSGGRSEVLISGTKTNAAFASSDFSDGNAVGVYITAHSDAAATTPAVLLRPSGNMFDNLKFTFGSGYMKPDAVIYYPEGITTADMYAYAPYNSAGLSAGNILKFSIENDQTNADASGSDLLWATKNGISATQGTPTLQFTHVLSKIIVKLTAGTGVTLSTPSVTIDNTLPSVNMNMGTGELSDAGGASVTISAAEISATEFHSIIVPQQLATGTSFISVTNGGKLYTYTIPATKSFKSGQFYTFEITVNRNDLEVTIAGFVSPWNPGDTTTGDAE